MSISIHKPPPSKIVYPDTDGKPMAENTLQFRWIVTIKEGLERVFQDRPNVFVAGDLLWYPVEGQPEICTAPDALVAFGRPKGDRGSYKQWDEDDIAPQAVFEVRSPNNRFGELYRKLKFYEQFGVDEYYLYDPDHDVLEGWQRGDLGLREIEAMNGWTSPRLGIRFDTSGSELKIIGPDGRPFRTFQEIAQERDQLANERDQLANERDQLANERDQLANERDQLANERDQLTHECDAERQRSERLAAQLRALGSEPSS
jgi:Uma2 family endonuclease